MKTKEEKITELRDQLHFIHYDLYKLIQREADKRVIAEFKDARRVAKECWEALGRARWGDKASPPLRHVAPGRAEWYE